jgi:hypothetical protein
VAEPVTGSIVVAGRELPVTRLDLEEGMLKITAKTRVERDWPAVTDEPAAVFGWDGQAVCRGWRVSIPAVRAGRFVEIVLPIRIASLESE